MKHYVDKEHIKKRKKMGYWLVTTIGSLKGPVNKIPLEQIKL
jgi:hypothetical protein